MEAVAEIVNPDRTDADWFDCPVDVDSDSYSEDTEELLSCVCPVDTAADTPMPATEDADWSLCPEDADDDNTSTAEDDAL